MSEQDSNDSNAEAAELGQQAEEEEPTGQGDPLVRVVTHNDLEIGTLTRKSDQKLFTSKEFFDVIFVVQDVEFPCHRIIVARQSPTLGTRLEQQWLELRGQVQNRADCLRMPVELIDPADTAADFGQVIEFIYTGRCTVTSHSILRILSVSNYLGVTSLRDTCGRLFLEWRPPTALGDVLAVSDRYTMTELRQLTIIHIALHFMSLLRTGALRDLNPQVWKAVLLSEFLTVTNERIILIAVKEYLAEQPDNTREAAIKQIMPCVRLLLLPFPMLHNELGLSPYWESPSVKMQLFHVTYTMAAQATQTIIPPQLITDFQERHPRESELQGVPRKVELSFDSSLCLGWELSDGGQVATAVADGGLASITPMLLDPAALPHGHPHVIGLPGVGNPGGFVDGPYVLQRAYLDRKPFAYAIEGRAAGPTKMCHTSYVAIKPGVFDGILFLELATEHATTNSFGDAELTILVMQNPMLKEGRLVAEQVGAAYVSGHTTGTGRLPGRVGRVVPIDNHDERGIPYVPVLRDFTCVEAIHPRDVVRVSIKMQTPFIVNNGFGDGRMGISEAAKVTFSKRGVVLGQVMINNLFPSPPVSQSRAAPVGATAAGPADPLRGWCVLVSTKNTGDVISLPRPEAGMIQKVMQAMPKAKLAGDNAPNTVHCGSLLTTYHVAGLVPNLFPPNIVCKDVENVDSV